MAENEKILLKKIFKKENYDYSFPSESPTVVLPFMFIDHIEQLVSIASLLNFIFYHFKIHLLDIQISVSSSSGPKTTVNGYALQYTICKFEFFLLPQLLANKVVKIQCILQHWTDKRIVWEPRDYGNVGKIVRQKSDLPRMWFPVVHFTEI